MDYAFVVESIGPNDSRNNTDLFKVIRKLSIPEENILFKNEDNISNLVEGLKFGDRVVVLSVIDLATNVVDLLSLFEELHKYGAVLYSIREPFFRGNNYYAALDQTLRIVDGYKELKRREGYESALRDGKIGRPKKAKQLEQAIKLINTEEFSVEEVSKLVNLSRSTIYKNLSKRKTSYKST